MEISNDSLCNSKHDSNVSKMKGPIVQNVYEMDYTPRPTPYPFTQSSSTPIDLEALFV